MIGWIGLAMAVVAAFGWVAVVDWLIRDRDFEKWAATEWEELYRSADARAASKPHPRAAPSHHRV